METKTLESLRQLAYRAHYGTSFSPEKRAETVVNEHSEEIDADIETIRKLGASDAQVERYESGYITKLSAYLSSHSNIVSSMIAGPSNFPARQMEKRNRWADNHYNHFREWRKKVLAAYERYAKKRAIDDAGGELAILKRKLESAKRDQERMKGVNVAIRKAKKDPAKIAELLNIQLYMAQELIVPDHCGRIGVPSYKLTNNLANIKRMEQRVKELESKEQKAETGQNEEIQIPGGIIRVDYSLDRITIKHDQKPSPEIIKELKGHGFRWSPHYGCWMRKITGNAMWTVKHLLLPKLAA